MKLLCAFLCLLCAFLCLARLVMPDYKTVETSPGVLEEQYSSQTERRATAGIGASFLTAAAACLWSFLRSRPSK